MKATKFIMACFLTLALSSILGCASLGGSQAAGINWALRESGGKITVFSEAPGHPASTLNNGITSSENWDQGEGWQASMSADSRAGRQRLGGKGRDRNWVIIDLPQIVNVSHVKIHTIDSEKYPAKDFGVSYLLVQYESEATLDGAVWISTDKYGKGVGAKDNIVRDNVNGVIDVRFAPVRTKRIRVLIYATNDMASSVGSRRRGGRGGRGGTIRLTEIEVFGT